MLSSSNYGITYNGKHSARDFGLKVIDKQIGFSAKTKTIIRPPHSNSVIDLSAMNGENIFGDRPFSVTFLLVNWQEQSKEQLYMIWTRVVNWLMDSSGRSPLVDDIMSGYYYLGEPEEAPDFDEFRIHGKLTVKWNCDPFRIAVAAEGNDIWNSFAFDLDVAQVVERDVSGTVTMTLINVGASMVQPDVICDAEMNIAINGEDAQPFAIGTTKPVNMAYPLVLKRGVNTLQITGTGHVQFDWHKEVI